MNEQIKSTVALLETYYWRYNRIASDEDLYKEYLVETDVKATLSEAKYVRYLVKQGVPVDGTITLSPIQVRWIDILCAAGDTRPLAVKAKEAGIPLAKHNNWMKNPLFQSALTSRLEKILPDEKVRVHSALAREASGGNVSAIKLYLQVTGEFTETSASPKGETASLMQGILEILETHVDRNVLSALADDFDYLLVNGRPPERRRLAVAVVPEKTRELDAIDVDNELR